MVNLILGFLAGVIVGMIGLAIFCHCVIETTDERWELEFEENEDDE